MGKRTKANFNLIDSNNFLKNTIKTHPKNESLVLCMICSPKVKKERLKVKSLQMFSETPKKVRNLHSLKFKQVKKVLTRITKNQLIKMKIQR